MDDGPGNFAGAFSLALTRNTTRADDRKHNGWTNYETWAVNLWLDNEEGTHDYWREQAQSQWNLATPTSYSTREEVAIQCLAEVLKDEHDEARPEMPGVYGDLLGAALEEVNWREIAVHFMDGIDKEESEDE